MPLCARIAGVDVCLFGPPAANHVQQFCSSPLSSSFFQNLYPCRTKSLTARPLRYRINSCTATIANGPSAHKRATRALETGEAMELPWVRFWRQGHGDRWNAADIVVIAARILPFLWIINVNTVVHAHRRRSSLTLTWGTTARHVLRGEESIQISKKANGDVVFHLRSFSRPHALVAWLTYPIIVYFQHRFARDVAKKVEEITNQKSILSTDDLMPVERGKPKQENLRGGRRYRYRTH